MATSITRTDRTAILATLNEAMHAAFACMVHAQHRADGFTEGDTASFVAGLRDAAATITERRHAHRGSDGAAVVMADTATTLRNMAHRLDSCAFEGSTTPGDWHAAAENARCEWSRMHGQRTLVESLFEA